MRPQLCCPRHAPRQAPSPPKAAEPHRDVAYLVGAIAILDSLQQLIFLASPVKIGIPSNMILCIYIYYIIYRYNMVKHATGWWYTYPSEKYESLLGWLFPVYGKIKNDPNHQPVIVSHLSTWMHYWYHKMLNLYEVITDKILCILLSYSGSSPGWDMVKYWGYADIPPLAPTNLLLQQVCKACECETPFSARSLTLLSHETSSWISGKSRWNWHSTAMHDKQGVAVTNRWTLPATSLGKLT